MAVDGPAARVDTTAAKSRSDAESGIGGLETRMERLEDRMEAMAGKLDTAVESFEGKMQLVFDRLDAHTTEMRVWMRVMQREHRADRRLIFSVLKDHRIRLASLEKQTPAKRRP